MLPKSILSRKDRIIISALDIIEQLGFQGLSTKELAARQGIAESALYRHFRSKDEIVVAVLEYYAKFDQSIFNTARQTALVAKEKIIYVITAYAEYHENYPALTAILCSYDSLRCNAVTQEVIKDTFFYRTNALAELVAEGQAQREIGTQFAADEIAEIIFGIYHFEVLKWRASDYQFSFKDRVVSIIKKFLASC